ncbi:MAG: hypothetical protein M9919_13725 [Burkholderiaceae bacterium]|nr:hypothetical protein [Burkholderiaceae bacterium]
MAARPLSDFKIRACVDWVQVRVTLPRPSQPRHVRARMPASWGTPPYADAIDGVASSRTFEFRVQNPRCANELFAQVQALAQNGHGFPETAIEITGIEVATDFFPTTDTAPARLAQVVAYLTEHLAKPPPGPRRMLHAGRFSAAAGRRNIVKALADGYSLFIGDKDAIDAARGYCKTYDTGDGKRYAPLAPGQHCARLERRLLGNDCPFTTLQGWRDFKFESLAGHFAMVRATDAPHPLIATLRDQWGPSLGTPDSHAKRTAHRRQSAPATAPDAVVNARIRQALRDLTKRAATAEKRCVLASASAASTEGNALEFGPAPKYLNTENTQPNPSPPRPCKGASPAWLPKSPPCISHWTSTNTTTHRQGPHGAARLRRTATPGRYRTVQHLHGESGESGEIRFNAIQIKNWR